MATIIILLGSILGFTAAATSFVYFDSSLLLALAIWGGSGPISALFAAVVTWDPKDYADEPGRPQLARTA